MPLEIDPTYVPPSRIEKDPCYIKPCRDPEHDPPTHICIPLGMRWFAVFLFATLPMQIGSLVMTHSWWFPAIFWALAALTGYDEYYDRKHI